MGQRGVLSGECTSKNSKLKVKVPSGMKGLIPEVSGPMMGGERR